MTLALRLGRTLEELGRTMTALEWSMWLELYEEHPWDGDWLHTGIICAMIANYAGKILPEGEKVYPSEFMPPWKKVVEEPDPLVFFAQFK